MVAVPSPATMTARELLTLIREKDGRVFRTQSEGVFVLTRSRELYEWLLRLGASKFSGGAYLRCSDGPVEYDCYIHRIPVTGGESVWGAAGR